MAWLYVPACRGSSSVYGAHSETHTTPSATWRGKPTPRRFWPRVWRTAAWSLRLFGTISRPSMAASGVARWISSLRDSRANPGAAQADASARPTPDGSGTPSGDAFATFDPHSSSWKTSRDLFGAASTLSSADWPASGSMRSGTCFRRPRAEPPTAAAASSSSLPTPQGYSFADSHQPGITRLDIAIRWPTPRVLDSRNVPYQQHPRKQGHRWPTLCGAVKWPTPAARDWRSGKASPATHARNSRPLSEVAAAAGGLLNPTWVEWLMGWPIGWTDCAHAATESFRRWSLGLSPSSSTD